MIIDCISDLHGYLPPLPGGDVLILAGDYTSNDKITGWYKFFEWLKQQQYKHKVLIAGNHDGLFHNSYPKTLKEAQEWNDVIDFLDIEVDFEYLCDSGVELIINGNRLKLWGTPWTPYFEAVNSKCAYFMENELMIDKKFSMIPEGLDILITHGPPLYCLDENYNGMSCGSWTLREHLERAMPRYHVFGHIHEQGGKELIFKHEGPNTYCMNCSYVDENYKPKNKYMRIDFTP